MAYDPAWPQNGQNIDADRFRDQFGGLKTLIDAGLLTDVVIDAVNTIAPGNPANVTASIVGGVLHLTFAIPQGNDGAQGPQGSGGSDGQQGPPGEVTNAQLTATVDAAIATTSSNSNAVAPLSLAISSSYNDAQVQAISDKLDELIAVMRRP